MIGKEVMYGQRLPRWYGVAWRDFTRDSSMCYPVPLNRAMRVLRNIWYWLRKPAWSKREHKENQIWRAGHRRGFEEGYKHGIRVEKERLSIALATAEQGGQF